MYRYAQINEKSIAVGDSWLSGEVTADNMIQIPEDLPSPLGKKYENGEFIDVPTPPDESINFEDMMEEMALNIEYLVVLQELNEGGGM